MPVRRLDYDGMKTLVARITLDAALHCFRGDGSVVGVNQVLGCIRFVGQRACSALDATLDVRSHRYRASRVEASAVPVLADVGIVLKKTRNPKDFKVTKFALSNSLFHYLN